MLFLANNNGITLKAHKPLHDIDSSVKLPVISFVQQQKAHSSTTDIFQCFIRRLSRIEISSRVQYLSEYL